MRKLLLAAAVGALAAAAAVRSCRESPPPPVAGPRPSAPVPAAPPEPPSPPAAAGRTNAPEAFIPPERIKPPEAFIPPRPGDGAVAVRGRVTLMGERPKRKRVRLDADPQCSALNAEAMLADDLVIGPENQVRWALLHVVKGLGDRRFDVPTTPAQIAQVGCRYVPHVLGVRVDQPIAFVNSDPCLHNVHGLPFANRGFNFGQIQGVEHVRAFPHPEIFKVACDIHPWMSAWIGVFDHPFFAVTDEEGGYRIDGLPPGRYEIQAWHEALKPESLEVDVGDLEVRRDFLLQRR